MSRESDPPVAEVRADEPGATVRQQEPIRHDHGRRTIATEILLYALLFVLFGAAIVAVQVARKGDSLLHFDPHGRER